MPQTWISKTTRKIFKVDNQPGINPVVQEEFEAARNLAEKVKATVLLKPDFPQNPQSN